MGSIKVFSQSHKKMPWVCIKRHTWKSTIQSRTNQKSGCLYCSGRRVSSDNSLAHLFTEIAAEWHPTKNGAMTPENVFNGSSKNAWWQCLVHKDHEYDMPIQRRSLRKQGCPYCAGKRKI